MIILYILDDFGLEDKLKMRWYQYTYACIEDIQGVWMVFTVSAYYARIFKVCVRIFFVNYVILTWYMGFWELTPWLRTSITRLLSKTVYKILCNFNF